MWALLLSQEIKPSCVGTNVLLAFTPEWHFLHSLLLSPTLTSKPLSSPCLPLQTATPLPTSTHFGQPQNRWSRQIAPCVCLQGNPRPAYPLVQKKLTSSDMAAYSLISKATERDVYHMKNTSLGCGVQGSTPRRNQSHTSPSEQCVQVLCHHAHMHHSTYTGHGHGQLVCESILSRLTNLLVLYKCLLLTARINQSNNYHNYKPLDHS